MPKEPTIPSKNRSINSDVFNISSVDKSSDIYTITVQFWSDQDKTIASHIVEYTLKYVDGMYKFLTAEVKNKGKYEPYSIHTAYEETNERIFINNIDDWAELYLVNDNVTYGNDIRDFIEAFLKGDTAYFERLYPSYNGTVNNQNIGAFDCLKTLKIGNYTIEKVDYNGLLESKVLFTFEVLESDMETLPVGKYSRYVESFVNINMNEYDDDVERTYSELQKNAMNLINLFSIEFWGIDPDKDLDPEKQNLYMRQVTAYIANCVGINSIEEAKDDAKTIFGLDNYEQPPYLQQNSDGTYSCFSSVGIYLYEYEIVAQREENGTLIFTVQYYVDPSYFVKGDTVEYSIRRENGFFIPVKAEIIYDSPYQPYHFST